MKISLVVLVAGCAAAGSAFAAFDNYPTTPPHVVAFDNYPTTPPHVAAFDNYPTTPPHAVAA